MAKLEYQCSSCHHKFVKWTGVCNRCKEWNSIKEIINSDNEIISSRNLPQKISALSTSKEERIKTKIGEVDRVLGSGFCRGSVNLLSGEPGVGKSTLLLKVVNNIACPSHEVLYVSGEETIEQISSRAVRLGVDNNSINILYERKWNHIKRMIELSRVKFLVIDSIQTINFESEESSFSSQRVIKDLTQEILEFVKTRGITCLIIGHITKDGNIAGPKLLEHMVDVVLYFYKSKDKKRVLKANKNRFGSTDSFGLFEMVNNGFKEINELKSFIDKYNSKSYIGRVTSVIENGSRVLPISIEALVAKSSSQVGKRICVGYDLKRLNLLVAIIEKRLGIKFDFKDIYIQIEDDYKDILTCIDTGVVMAILSSLNNTEISATEVFSGEIKLSGIIKKKKELNIDDSNLIERSFSSVVDLYKNVS